MKIIPSYKFIPKSSCMKRFLFLVTILFSGFVQAQSVGEAKMNLFISALMKKMTLTEKLGQLNLSTVGDFVTGQASNLDIANKIRQGRVGGLFNIKAVAKIRELQQLAVEQSRLKIPLLFGMDVIHGYETVFPIPLALSCSWDMSLIERSARIAAIEASADGINWTFSPMVDIARDPRWGRVAEGGGEDPYLGSQIARAMVHGYQGDDLSKHNTILSCVKHFALYGAAEAGREYNTTDMSRIRMYNEYFPPYKAAINAGAGSVMASFNEVDGIPATGNRWLMQEVLRNQWKFNGLLVSDYTGISEMVNHGVGDSAAVAAMALRAGVDMDMVSELYVNKIPQLLSRGQVTMAQIDEACRRTLVAKYQLGLFEDPYRYCDGQRAKTEVFSDAHRSEARKMAPETFVLLKNQGGLLPLKKTGTIALVGPLADNKENMTGTWSVAAKLDQATSLLAGMKTVAGSPVRILHARGSNLDDDSSFEARAGMFGKSLRHDPRSKAALIEEALAVAAESDVIVAALGESAEMSGESSSRADIGIPQAQRDLLEALVKTGKPVVLVLFTGRPLTLPWESKNVPSILNVWFAGSEAGYAIADVLFGDQYPSGKLTTTFPQHVGQVPLYYASKHTGRPLSAPWFQKFQSNYLDVSNEPLYPFGYGISYTTFRYSPMKLSATQRKGNQTLTVSVDVQNTGKTEGKEVVQLYIRDLAGSVTRPVKELKGFKKIQLAPNETRSVTFQITPEELKFYNSELNYVWEPGAFEIMVGSSAQDVQRATINWEK